MLARHSAKMENQAKFDSLVKLAFDYNYQVRFEPTKYANGWPSASTKPYQLRHADGSYIACFSNLAALEKSLRGRAGC